jgi:hypothetical protein
VRLIIAPTNGGTNASFFEQDYRIQSEGKGWHFLSTYASAEYRLLPELAVVGGGRLDYFNANGELTASPRLLLRWSPAPGTKLTAATGIYRQAPVYVANGMALDGQYGNPNLLDERSIHRVLGFEQELDSQWLVRLEAFQKSYSQMVSEDADPAINYRNAGRRTSYGFDVFLQKKIGGWLDGWVSYSCILSKDIIDTRSDAAAYGKPAYDKPLGEWFHPAQDRRHTFTLVANITPHPEWKGSISYRFGSGMPYTPLESVESYYDAERDKTVYRPVWGAYHSRRLPAYHRLDIRIDMPFFGVEGWSSFLQFINLFDNHNVSAYSYESDYAKRKEQTMLPFMLIGGFRFGF